MLSSRLGDGLKSKSFRDLEWFFVWANSYYHLVKFCFYLKFKYLC
jgi:hypothetical protein